MDHGQIKEKLFQISDAEFPSEERQTLLAHLQSCGECRKRAESLSRWQKLLSQSGLPEPSEAFVSRVMARIPLPEKPPVRSFRVRRAWPWGDILKRGFPALGYALALVVIGLALIPRESLAVSTDAMLLVSTPQEIQWTFAPETPEIQDMFGIEKEG